MKTKQLFQHEENHQRCFVLVRIRILSAVIGYDFSNDLIRVVVVIAPLVECRVNDRKVADFGSITKLAMRCCVPEKDSYNVYFPLEP